MDLAAGTRSDRSRIWPIVAVAVAGLALFQFYGNSSLGYINTRSLFYWWGYQWSNEASEAQHGWMVLGLAAWLFWRNLYKGVEKSRSRGVEQLDAPPFSGDSTPRLLDSSTAALAALVVALLLHAAGFLMQQARVSILALLLFIHGLAKLADSLSETRGQRSETSLQSLVSNRSYARAAAFPLLLLVFAIPLNVLDTAGFWLRMGVIRTSATIAHAVGIGVIRNGTLLMAPDGRYQYDVAAACSGVRSLMALAAISALFGYLYFKSVRLRAAVFVACVPLVFVGNVARVFSIIVAAHWGGAAWGDRVHDIMEWGVVLIVACGVYLLANSTFLQRFDKTLGGAARPATLNDDAQATSAAGTRRSTSSLAIAIIFLIAIEMIVLHWVATMPPRGAAGIKLSADGLNPVELPTNLGLEWIGKSMPVTQAERDVLPPDTGYSKRRYTQLDHLNEPDKEVLFSVILSGRDRTSIHRPELCLVGQGWTIDGSSQHLFGDVSAPGAGVTATVLRVEHDASVAGQSVAVPGLVVYWFVSSDATVSTHWARIARDAWARLVHLRSDRWAYILLQTGAADGEAAALSRIQEVLNKTLPTLKP